jgi:hypothetical protein
LSWLQGKKAMLLRQLAVPLPLKVKLQSEGKVFPIHGCVDPFVMLGTEMSKGVTLGRSAGCHSRKSDQLARRLPS